MKFLVLLPLMIALSQVAEASPSEKASPSTHKRSEKREIMKERWSTLSPEEKAEFKKNKEEFKKLSPEKKAELKKFWSDKTPEQKRKFFKKTKEMSPKERRELKEKLNKMSEPERRKYMDKMFSRMTIDSFIINSQIAAVLESEVMMASKGSGQTVRVKVLSDVHDAQNNVVIPKGSVLSGEASAFDKDTGVMKMNFTEAKTESGEVFPVDFSLNSSNGQSGLRGQVLTTSGKYVLGAFTTSFSKSERMNEKVDVPSLIQSSNSVLPRVKKAYSTLQTEDMVYFVPKGVPVILQ